MITTILNWLSGGVLDRVLGYFERTAQARRESLSEERKQAYANEQHIRETAKEVRLATAGFWEMRVLTAVVLFMFVSHLGLIWVDTMWPQPWDVEKFPSPIDEYEWQIILSLFGLGVANRGISALATVLVQRRR